MFYVIRDPKPFGGRQDFSAGEIRWCETEEEAFRKAEELAAGGTSRYYVLRPIGAVQGTQATERLYEFELDAEEQAAHVVPGDVGAILDADTTADRTLEALPF